MFGTFFVWVKEYGVLLLELFKTYGKKAVFAILLVGAALVCVGYIVDVKLKKVIPETIETSVETSMEKSIETQEIMHVEKLIQSQDVYSEVKQKLRSSMKECGFEYVYLIEYHNGSSNIATAFPFRKFDVTMDICKDGVPYIDTSPLKDEHITKYDIFDNPEFTKQQFAYCSREEFKKVDIKLYHMMEYNKSIKWVYTYNLYYDNSLLGAVLVLSYKELDIRRFVNCMHELELIFNK